MSDPNTKPEPTTPGEHKGNWHVLIVGMPRVDAPLQLAPGVTLRPLEDSLSVFDLAAAGAAGFRAWAVLEPLAHGCFNEIETARDSDVTPGYDTLNRAWLASGLLGLRGFTGHLGVACSGYSWGTVAGHQERTSHVFHDQVADEGVKAAVYRSKRDLPPFKGNLLDYHLNMLTVSGARTDAPTEDDSAWVRSHFESFNKLAADSEAFRFGLEASIDWRYGTDARAAVARIWGGIEGLFGIKSELVFRLSSVAASLLEARGAARRERFVATKKLYAARSKVVHGATMKQEEIQHALDESYGLLCELLLVVIDRGQMFDGDDQLDALLA